MRKSYNKVANEISIIRENKSTMVSITDIQYINSIAVISVLLLLFRRFVNKIEHTCSSITEIDKSYLICSINF